MKILRLLLIASFANFTLCAQTINEVESDPPKGEIEIVETSTSQSNTAAKNGITYCDSLVLGLVEGLTEYLPVSSTGHLLLANAFLGLDADEPLSDAAGNPILNDNFEPLTLKSAADAYAIVIQLGAIAAVAFIYWEWLLKMFFGLLGRNPASYKHHSGVSARGHCRAFAARLNRELAFRNGAHNSGAVFWRAAHVLGSKEIQF